MIDIVKTLKACKGGEVIELGDSAFGALSLSKLRFAEGVMLKGGTFSQITLNDCEGIRFHEMALNFVPNSETLHHSSAFRANDCKNIAVTGSVIKGGPAVNGVEPSATKLDSTQNVLGKPAGRGIFLFQCEDMEIEGNDISQFHKGIVLSKVSDLSIVGNDIHHLRTTPLSGSGLREILVDSNHFHDADPWNFGGDGDHGDLIHFWTLPGYDAAPVPGITITNNRLRQGDGFAMLGIYLDDNGNGIGFANTLIENNIVDNDNHQAIRLENVSGAVMRNSLISQGERPPMIILRDGCDVNLSGNICAKIDADETSTPQGDLTGTGVGSTLAPQPETDQPVQTSPVVGVVEYPARQFLTKAVTEAHTLVNNARRTLYAAEKALTQSDLVNGGSRVIP